MKKKDVAMLVGGTLIGMSAVMTGAAWTIIHGHFTRRKPKDAKPGQIESVDAMHMDYLLRKSMETIKAQKCEEISIESWDGLLLTAHYIHNTTVSRGTDEPVKVVILSHGYGGSGYRDLAIFGDFYIKEGYDLLIIDQRAHGHSEGDYITFGGLEQIDIRDWTDKVVQIAGRDCRILLHGWSMGAAAVYLAATGYIAPQVRGIIYDCGYAVAEAQLMDAAYKYCHLPKSILWYTLQFVKPLTRLICGFDLRESSPLFVASEMNLPILFVHGEEDSVVDYRMGRRLYRATKRSPYSRMLSVPGADHTYSYAVDKKGYEAAIRALMEYCMGN